MLRQIAATVCIVALLCPVMPGQLPDNKQNPQPASSESSAASPITIPEGTEIQLSLRDPLSSKLSEPGDEVYAVVRRDVVIDGRTLLKQGTEIIGRVTATQPARKMLRGGMLHISFDRVRLDSGEQKLSALIRSASNFETDEKIKSDSEGSLKGGKSGGDVLKNVGTAASVGGAAASVIILSSADRSALGIGNGIGGISRGGAVAGATVLGVSMVAGILLTKGREVRLNAGTLIRLKLERPLAVG
jgi:hypothetical protein